MPIRMTKEQYTAKYGVAPYSSSESTLDITVPPVRMTQEEYDAKYNQEEGGGLLGPAKEAIAGLAATYGGGEQGIANRMKQNIVAGAADIQKGDVVKGLVKSGARVAGDYAGLVYAPVGAAIQATGYNKLTDYISGELWKSPIGQSIIDLAGAKPSDYTYEGGKMVKNTNPVTGFLERHPNLEVDAERALNLFPPFIDKGTINPKTAIPRTIAQVKSVIGKSPLKGVVDSAGNTVFRNESGEVVRVTNQKGELTFNNDDLGGQPIEGSGLKGLPNKIVGISSKIQENRKAKSDAKRIEKLANEIAKIENNYVSGRKANEYSKDSGASSRNRIAQTDVLVDSVDTDGLIRTKKPGGAVEQYRKLTIDGSEGVVRENLIREGAKAHISEVAKELTVQVYRSGLEGADLLKAVNGLKAELKGLALRADELGMIDLSKIHDAKISTTSNINYQTDSTPTIKYRKAKAFAYKSLVENKSKIEIDVNGKKYGVTEINAELGKYYDDLSRLEALDGKRVKGGKLGKYTAQITGNIVGGAVGGAVGGIPGAAVGTVIGGETSAFMRGKSMSRTFGDGTGNEITKNPILEKAKAEGQMAPEVNLRMPDVKVGAPKDTPKTKEVFKLEGDIAKNVEQQKAAIRAGNFDLVAILKDIYQVLVQHLKDTIKEIRKNSKGGFIRPNEPIFGKGKSQSPQESPQSSSKDSTLSQEARKYKSAEEFVGAQGETLYRGGKNEGSSYSKNRKVSEDFVKNRGGEVKEFILSPESKIINYDDVPNIKYKGIDDWNLGNYAIPRGESRLDFMNGRLEKDYSLAEKWAKENGYDAIRFPTEGETRIINKNAVKTKSQLTDIWNKANTKIAPQSTTLGERIIATGDQKPTIKLKRDVQVTTLSGEKVTIPEDEVLKAYESGGKMLLKDGREYIVSKNQYQNIKGNAVSSEAKEFAPELKGVEETVKGASKWKGDELIDNGETVANLVKNEDGTWSYQSDMSEGSETFKTKEIAMREAELSATGTYSPNETKYSQYQLPEGKNYKEVLIKAPGKAKKPMTYEKFVEMGEGEGSIVGRGDYEDYLDEFGAGKQEIGAGDFRSSHWDEPNVISHLRLNERTYQGKKVTFMEELQSDWAREGRSKGFEKPFPFKTMSADDLIQPANSANLTQAQKTFLSDFTKRWDKVASNNGDIQPLINEYEAWGKSQPNYPGIPNNPNLKNWQELSIKRALKDAVDNKSDYFAWINGEQTSARYNLATKLDNVKWVNDGPFKRIDLSPTGGRKKYLVIRNDSGFIQSSSVDIPTDWKGKKLDEVLGKGLADKIMEKESGTLAGEGLKFGGEWADNLYNKQVKNIVEDLTGGKVEMMDMGLPVEKNKTSFSFVDKSDGDFTKTLTKDKMKAGMDVRTNDGKAYIITDVLGDGKFKAVPKDMVEANGRKIPLENISESRKETFDISTKKTVQQGIKLTPEIKALIKGESRITN